MNLLDDRTAVTDAPHPFATMAELPEAVRDVPPARWLTQRAESRLHASFFPLLAESSQVLCWLDDGGGAVAKRSEIERRRILRGAMVVRDIAWEALRNVLPPLRRGEVDSLVAGDETAEDLTRSMDGIAGLLELMLADTKDAVTLAACGLDSGCAAALRRRAAVLRAAERAAAPGAQALGVTGLLRLIATAYRALRSG